MQFRVDNHRRRSFSKEIGGQLPPFFGMIAFDADPFRRAALRVMRQAEGLDICVMVFHS